MSESTIEETEVDDQAVPTAEQESAESTVDADAEAAVNDADPTVEGNTQEETSVPEAADEEAGGLPGTQNATATVFEEFSKDGKSSNSRNDIDMILDIPVLLTVELGRTKIPIKNLLQLAQGSVVELDGIAGEPMDVLVNGCLIAQGEVVVVNEKFGIRLTDVITPSERIRKLNR